jgi:hypothetical protein
VVFRLVFGVKDNGPAGREDIVRVSGVANALSLLKMIRVDVWLGGAQLGKKRCVQWLYEKVPVAERADKDNARL